MALTTPSLSGAIITAAQSRFPGSQLTPKLALAVARSIMAWVSVLANVTVQGITSGTAGVGSVNGKLGFSGAPNLVSIALNQAGVTGPTANGTGMAVGAGTLATLNASAQYTGASAGVGTGADVSKVSNANPATLIPILLANLSGQQVAGASTTQLATGLANGISTLMLTGAGAGGVVGPASPIGAAGTSVSVVF